MLLRNKYYIVMYRGKDFVPTSVAAVLTERQELTKDIQAVEEKLRIAPVGPTNVTAAFGESQELTEDETDFEEKACGVAVEGQALAGTLAEFCEAQARWGREITPHDQEKMIKAAAKAKTSKMVKEIEHKLALVSEILSIVNREKERKNAYCISYFKASQVISMLICFCYNTDYGDCP